VNGDVTRVPWVILGCGYTGERLAARLVRAGASVWGTRRAAADADALAARVPGLRPRAADLTDPASLAGWMPRGAIWVDSVPPAPAGVGGEQALVAAAAAAGARRLVYLSSTGVYPRGHGGATDEDTPPAPLGDRGRRRLAAETALLEAAARQQVDAVSLRIAGIYGPGRGVHARLRQGTYRIIGAGASTVSRIHVDDLVSAILAAGVAARLPRRIYNVADDAPCSSRAFADAVAALLGVPPPPSVPPEQVSAAAVAMLTADRRISSRRLQQELGVVLAYPDGLAGVRQAIAEEAGAAGDE
jgi:nucleoside-diphosphate-sugar epimerase